MEVEKKSSVIFFPTPWSTHLIINYIKFSFSHSEFVSNTFYGLLLSGPSLKTIEKTSKSKLK